MDHLRLLSRLARPSQKRIVLLVIDGVGDIRTETQPKTALEVAETPNLDALAVRSSLGRIIPADFGITPGSGPGHLSLFGYDPLSPDTDIGRGVLEALGLGLTPAPGQIAARGNFATADDDGRLTDRRAGRIPTSESQRLCAAMAREISEVDGVEVEFHPGEGHRFVVLLSGSKLSHRVEDTDPQKLGVPPLAPRAAGPDADRTVEVLKELVARMNAVLDSEPKANRALLRGFSSLPHLPSMSDLYRMRCGAFAGYPLYRGVASACGMDVLPCPKRFPDAIPALAEKWDAYDFFFVHVKQTDQAGEDGNLEQKKAVLEEVDAALPRLLELGPDVLAITGDHSTPCPMAAHSWHPVPLLINGALAFVDDCQAFHEEEATRGSLGLFPAEKLMGLLLAHAGRLAKFGA